MTGVQTCALPISDYSWERFNELVQGSEAKSPADIIEELMRSDWAFQDLKHIVGKLN